MIFIDVIDRSSSDKFNTLVRQKPTLVLFFSPDCGHCRAMKDDWKQMTEILKKKYRGDMMVARVRDDMIGDVDCYKKIRGYPSIIALDKGEKRKEFMGDRKVTDFLKFIEGNFSLEGGPRRRRLSTRRRRTRRRRRRRRHRRRVAGHRAIEDKMSGGGCPRRQTRRRRRRRNRRIKRRKV